MNERLAEIESRYLGQSIEQFVVNGGDAREYARLVFAREIFGAAQDPAAPELDINTEADLVEALDLLIAGVEVRERIPVTAATAPVFMALAWERIHADDLRANGAVNDPFGVISGLAFGEVLADGGLRVTPEVRLPTSERIERGPAVDLFGERDDEPQFPGTSSIILDFWVGDSAPDAYVQMTIRGVQLHDLGRSYQRYAGHIERQAVAEYRAWLAANQFTA